MERCRDLYPLRRTRLCPRCLLARLRHPPLVLPPSQVGDAPDGTAVVTFLLSHLGPSLFASQPRGHKFRAGLPPAGPGAGSSLPAHVSREARRDASSSSSPCLGYGRRISTGGPRRTASRARRGARRPSRESLTSAPAARRAQVLLRVRQGSAHYKAN